jgi:hypothetical protein
MDATGLCHDGDGGGGHHLPPASEAFRAALHALCAELEKRLVDPAPDGDSRDIVRRVVDRGRTDGLNIGHLIIAFRRSWDGEQPVLRAIRSTRRDAVRWAVVSTLITAYYANIDSPATVPSAGLPRDESGAMAGRGDE